MKLEFSPPGATHPLSAQQITRTVASFKDTITRMSLANGARATWWYTWLASRDRFNSGVFNHMVALAPVDEATARVQTEDPVLFNLFQKRPGLRASLKDRLNGRLKLLANALAVKKRWLGEVFWFVSWYLNERNTDLPSDADVILVTQFNDGTFKNGEFRDTYFGPLAAYLAEQGERTLTCGSLNGLPSDLVKARRGLTAGRHGPLTSFGRFLRLSDFFHALWHSAFHGIRTDIDYGPEDKTTKPLLDHDIRQARPHIFHGLMIERASRRLLARYPSARIIHMYENNPWEHALNRQARLFKRDTTGFLHCAILPSHFKNYLSREEQPLRPAPDRIVCTGEAARKVFLDLGDHDPDRVHAGCDLRATRPQADDTHTFVPGPVRTALVILEGLPNMVGFLQFLDEAARKLPETEFRVRAHPALPLDTLLRMSGAKCQPEGPLVRADQTDLTAQIKSADVVLYQGTTAAMTAVYLGVPVVKFDACDGLEDDPLFQCPYLKKVVRTIEDLERSFRDLASMDPGTYAKQANQARDYIDSYLTVPGPETMRIFTNQALPRNRAEQMAG